MRDLVAPCWLPEEEVALLKGKFLGDRSYDLLVGGQDPEPVTVRRPDGEVLLMYLPGAVPDGLCKQAWPVLRKVGGNVANRGTAAGFKAVRPIRQAGYRSKTLQIQRSEIPALTGVNSAILGAFERNSARYPVCRLTAFNLDHPEKFARCVPYFQAIDQAFRQNLPERWEAQMSRVRETHPAWVVHGTAFTTVTVNRDFRTAVHQDAGDLKEGFGVLSVLRAGTFHGCHLVFPAFRVAADLRTGGVLLADVHQWHGNTELIGVPGKFERVSCVLYYRAKMIGCGSPEEELERGKNRKPGDPIWDKPPSA